MPVVAPLAISYESEALNVDGDRVAAAIGAALKAQTLIILSNVPGLLRDSPTKARSSPISRPEKPRRYLDRMPRDG